MKKNNKELLKVVKWVIENEVEKNIHGWPPPCSGILHQPMRPIHNEYTEFKTDCHDEKEPNSSRKFIGA